MKKTGVVILGAGLLQTPLIKAAKKRGWYVITADMNPDAPGKEYADTFLQVSTRDASGIIDSLKEYSGQFHYCCTLGTDMTATVAAVNHAYGLAGLTPAQAEATTHKGKMRQFLTQIGLEQPAFIITSDKSSAYEWANLHNFETGFVIKPVHNMGARGVMFIQKPDDLAFAFEYAAAHALDGEVILEEYIEADELSVDALCINSETFITGLADRKIEIRQGRYFIETGHTMPTQKDRKVHELIHAQLQTVNHALGKLGNVAYRGALKGDIRLTKEQKIIIGEVATRLSGGFMSTHTYPLASENDLLSAYLDVLENKIPDICRSKFNDTYQNVTIERALLSPPGIVRNMELPEYKPPAKNTRIQEVFIHCKPGDYIGSLQSNLGKPGNIIISAPTLEEAETCALEFQKQLVLDVQLTPLTRKELNSHARKHFIKSYCHVCKICDGLNCSSGVPGMGGIGEMKSFQDNLIALAEIKIQDSGVSGTTTPSLTSYFLDKKLSMPILNAPITGSITNMGGSITEYDHAIEIAMGLKALGLPAMYGDGASPDKYLVAIESMRQCGGGFLVVKPRTDNKEIIRRIQDAEAAGADGWGIDVDAVNLITMKNKSQTMSKKTARDLQEISRECKLPFFIKGIMTFEDALEMAEGGARALIVSNHGGRIDDSLPGSARVVGRIAEEVKKRFPEIQIYADGGIRSGEDVFKMLALGADGVLVGRPVTIAAVAAARLGAYSVLKMYSDELAHLMSRMDLTNLKEIQNKHIKIG